MAPASGPRARKGGDRPLILHLSGDFPDSIAPDKTSAIRNLIDLTADRFEHYVVSMNRSSPGLFGSGRAVLAPGKIEVTAQQFDYGVALSYCAPSKGVRHGTRLLQLGEWLAEHIAQMPKKPAFIIGHKMAIEGIAVRRASALTGIPYGLSIQGDSDTKIMNVRRDLKDEFAAVLHNAKAIFPFTPWAWERITGRLGVPHATPILLPCPTELDQPLAPVVGGNGLVSVFHLKSHKRKNLAGIVQAFRLLERNGQAPPLSIIGGGDPADRVRCEAIAAQTRSITFQGPKGRDDVRIAMNTAAAFVLPSLRETFGMVFIEALFAGSPIIYPKGTSVDGYFDGAPFALGIDARDPSAIVDAIIYAIENETEIKAALADWQQSDAKRLFQRDSIGEAFSRGIENTLSARQ